MRAFEKLLRQLLTGCAAGGVLGCSSAKTFLDEHLPPPGRSPAAGPHAAAAPPPARDADLPRPPAKPGGPVVPAGGQAEAGQADALPAPAAPLAVDDFVRLAVARNPRIARATIAIDAAQGRYVQAGLYPNPDLAVNWDEIGDRSSPDRLGILTAPRITQTIVTAGKLKLSQVVAAREIDQATLGMLAERYAVVGTVRAAFYEAYATQRRVEVLTELLRLAEEAVATGKTLLENKQIARLDLVQLEVERERFRAELRAARGELPATYKRLAAAAGDSGLPVGTVAGSFEGLPAYDLEQVRAAVLASHPEVGAARVGVDRAQAAVRRAEVEPIPNVSVYGAYIRQYENRSHDGAVGLSMPIPIWNRNQGNIRAAKAELGMAIQAVGRVENELAARVAAAYQTYAAARARAEQYRAEIIPRAEETYKLSLGAFKGGQFEYLRVIAAQRAVSEARLEYNRALGEAWRAAAELSGLLLEESWPGPAALPENPQVKPIPKPEPPGDVPGK
jgi:cobalt-zinc-cadmium efflux system outer membrane protein